MFNYDEHMNTIKTLQAEADRIADLLKAEKASLENAMLSDNLDKVTGERYTAALQIVKQNRLDGDGIRRDYPGIASQYTKETEYFRLNIRENK